MKNKFKFLLIIITLFIFIVYIKTYNKAGNINLNDGVYTNKYFNISLVEPNDFYIDKDFSCKYINSSEINLFKMVSNLSYEKGIILATAHKLKGNLEEFIDLEFKYNKKNMTNVSNIKKEGKYMTYEYKNNKWNSKDFIYEKRGYAKKIVISYKYKKDKDYYLHNINLISGN